MNIIKEYKEFNDVTEDKIYKFSEYEPTKYNGNVVVDQIMEWLRAKLLEAPDSDMVGVPLDVFFKECAVNRNAFMTFYNEMDKTNIVKSFKVEIKDNYILFNEFKNNEENEIS